MTYLVTGGTGFLGRYIVAHLEAQGHTVYITTRNPKQANHIKADFETWQLDTEAIKQKLNGRPDDLVVVHAAGKAHMVPKTDAEKKAFFEVNVAGTGLLMKALQELDTLPKSFVFISSVSVYGLDSGTDIAENTPLKSEEPYGLSKIEAEKMLTEWGSDTGITIGMARLPLIAGKNAPGNLEAMIKGIKSGRYFRIGSGAARKSMVWAGDIAAIIPTLAEKGGTYNFTDGIHPSFAELEDAITGSLHMNKVKTLSMFVASLAGLAGTVMGAILRRNMPIDNRRLGKIVKPLTFSDAKARQALGWKPSPVLQHINEMTA